MIPLLPKASLSPLMQQFADCLKKQSFRGDIHFDIGALITTSTDNSIYQVKPQLVLFPKDKQDIIAIFSVGQKQDFQSITFSPRGGGTGTNGQSLNKGVMIDCTRYMNHIEQINTEQQWAKVQPAVVLDQLNDAVKDSGLFFAPNLSPSNRATLGGMVNTDACGKGSRLYGRTSQHIVAIEFVCVDGTEITSQSISFAELTSKLEQSDHEGQIYQTVYDVINDNETEIERRFPKLARFMTGYNLAKVIDHQQKRFNLNYILSGSEGTLVYVTGLTLKLTPIPAFKRLFALQYATFEEALRSAKALLDQHPAAIETIDDNILNLAREDEIYAYVSPMLVEPEGKKTGAVNLVELIADNQPHLDEQSASLKRQLKQLLKQNHLNSYYETQDPEQMNQLWNLRKKGVGLLGNMKGARKPVAFMEDTAVPPDQLADYIVKLRQLLDHYGLKYGMFGHVDVGCLHMRPALDMTSTEHQRLVPILTNQVNELVRQYGGVYWSEHGKGFRSEYVKQYFGDALYQGLSRIKSVFDPANRLNPGKIVTPDGSSDQLVQVDGPFKGRQDAEVDERVRQYYAGAFNCNGNAACLNYNYQEVICPSAKVSRNWVHSPKGRSGLLREWVYQLSRKQYNGLLNGAKTNGLYWIRSLFQNNKADDFSHEVYASMEHCLGCKACASSCPLKVNIPNMRADFLSQYHTRYRRPLKDYILAGNERITYLQAKMPGLSNWFNTNKVTQALARRLGLQDLPQLSTKSISKALKARGVPVFSMTALASTAKQRPGKVVCLVQDVFTSFYQPEILLDTYDLLTHLGYKVYVLPFRPNGKALHNKGFLKAFNKLAQSNTRFYNQIASLEVPLVGLEPSMTLCYRDEYLHKMDHQVHFKVSLINEWLAGQLDSGHLKPLAQSANQACHLYLHCSEKALALTSSKDWQKLFNAFNINLKPQATGCCGMAGAYGHESKHYQDSQQLYEMSWQQPIEKSGHTPVVTGFSCRCQVQRFSSDKVIHPISKLKQAVIG